MNLLYQNTLRTHHRILSWHGFLILALFLLGTGVSVAAQKCPAPTSGSRVLESCSDCHSVPNYIRGAHGDPETGVFRLPEYPRNDCMHCHETGLVWPYLYMPYETIGEKRAFCFSCHDGLTAPEPMPSTGGHAPNSQLLCNGCHDVHRPKKPGSGYPLTGPHALFGDPNCGSCHDHASFPGTSFNPGGLASIFCATCHDPATVASLHSHTVTGSTRFDYSLECTVCHDQHGWGLTNIEGGENIRYLKGHISAAIDVVDHTAGDALVQKVIDNDVVFMDVGDFDDGDAVYTEDICNTCHTLTSHHQNDGVAPGGQSHHDGEDCTSCHMHADGFAGFDGPHPQATTDCSNCHLGQDGGSDLVSIHGDQCNRCHVTSIPGTFLGPVGTWDQSCDACHNPETSQTGSMEIHTNGHRCVVCHGQQMDTTASQSIHWNHAEDANCVVCHGFIPDMGTVIGSGNRDLCGLCHVSASGSIRGIHQTHTQGGLSCLECHGDERPPVDTVFGPPVGGASIICEICHSYEYDTPRGIHNEHVRKLLDCGSCHMDATLQDDRVPMLPVDDVRRDMVNRSEWQECFLCHSNESGSTASVHRRHNRQWQWCYNCHEGDDVRPSGGSGPVMEPAESCQICHSGYSYSDEFPFDVHERHAGALKCYSCHQAEPEFFDWPAVWLGGVVTEVSEPENLPTTRLTNSPNPFNPVTEIKYALRIAGNARLSVHDVSGKLVAVLFDGHIGAGVHTATWNGRDAAGVEAASSVYFVRLVANGEVQTKKICLVR